MNLSIIWNDFLSIAKVEAGSRVVETWLKAAVFTKWDDLKSIVYIESPNQFVKDWICTQYEKLLITHLSRLLFVKDLKIIFLVKIDEKTSSQSMIPASTCSISSLPSNFNLKKVPSLNFGIKNIVIKKDIEKNFGKVNSVYQFSSFVVGPNASLAYAASKAVSESPGSLYNPLFIYGASGLGKTHLLHAIGNVIQERNNKAIISYQTTDRFVNEFINAIRFNKVHVFQQKYKSIDVLLIDDIQFISSKDQTQEAFFHIFNMLYEAKKQIVFTSDVVPSKILGLTDRLKTRFEGGLITDIHKPSLETKIAILKKKAILHNESISDDVAEFIASCVNSSVRELEGALIRVCAFASLTKQEINLDLAIRILSETSMNTFNSESMDFDHIVNGICRFYSYKLADLRSDNRSKNLSIARQVAMYFMKKFTSKSLKEIGNFLLRKNHTTVMHAYEKVDKLIKSDPLFKITIDKIEKEFLI